ncbi:MAG: hypothetical protein H6825_03185 [Planctomycetes bacterium]|nr:hypothetical protein [Planctomycetota bacterium]
MKSLLIKLLLAAAAYGLWTWNADLARVEAEARQASNRVGRLVDPSERDAMRVAAVTVTSGAGQSWMYARVDGLWRCLDAGRTVADEAAIAGLVDAILRAEGVARTDDPSRFGDYGIGTPDGWTVTLHGSEVLTRPDKDVQLELAIGLPVEGLDGCFVRRADRDVVWAIDTDPRSALDEHPEGQPPLLDHGVMPAVWPGQGIRLDKIQVDRVDGVRFQLDLREEEISPDDMQRGLSPWKWWMLRPDVEAVECHPMLATAYTVFLRQCEWAEVVPPDKANTVGLELPTARVLLVTSDEKVTQLVFGAVLADGRVPMFNSFSNQVVLLDESTASLLTPSADQLLPGTPTNLWDLALHR